MPQWLRTKYIDVKLRCPREPHKIATMQLQYDVFTGNTKELTPYMNCHNDYGLPQCNICKKHLYDYLTSPHEHSDSPIELGIEFSESF